MGVGICVVNNPVDLQWSPFVPNLLCVACSNRPGHTPISGVLYTLEFLPANDIQIQDQVQLNVGLSLVACSERSDSTVAAACADNTLRFFDLRNDTNVMVREWFLQDYPSSGHNAAAASDNGGNGGGPVPPRSLQWDRISLEQLLTANGAHHSVDVHSLLLHEEGTDDTGNGGAGTVADEHEPHVLFHCDAHEGTVMDAKWDTSSPFCFMSCDQAGFVYLWDTRQDPRRERYAMRFRMHNNTCAMRMDQNLYDENSIALGCFNQSMMTYDLRATRQPKAHIKHAHYSLITDVQWSPHTQHLVATSSTDRTLRIWDMRESNAAVDEHIREYGVAMHAQQQQQQEQSRQRNDREAEGDDENTALAIVDQSYGGAVSSFKSQKMEDWVHALDWNVHEVGLMALSCNDHLVKAYNVRED